MTAASLLPLLSPLCRRILNLHFPIPGNACLVYSIIRKRQVFYQLANLPTTDADIREILTKHGGGGLLRRFDLPPHADENEDDEDDEEEEEEAAAEAPPAPLETKLTEIQLAPSNGKAKDEAKDENVRLRISHCSVIHSNIPNRSIPFF